MIMNILPLLYVLLLFIFLIAISKRPFRNENIKKGLIGGIVVIIFLTVINSLS